MHRPSAVVSSPTPSCSESDALAHTHHRTLLIPARLGCVDLPLHFQDPRRFPLHRLGALNSLACHLRPHASLGSGPITMAQHYASASTAPPLRLHADHDVHCS
eukprot:6185714-Pleurochrysis_carterae.AAC.1